MSSPSTTPPDGLLDIDGLAEYLDLPRSWVRDKVTARAIPHRRIGRHVRFAPEDVVAIVDAGYVPVQTAPRRDQVAARRHRPAGLALPAH